MKLKNISKLLTIGVLLNSISFNSFAGILSEDTRYETFEDNFITINDVLEEDNVDIKIEGNTLVNIATGRLKISKVGDYGAIHYSTEMLKTDSSTTYTVIIRNLPSNTRWCLTTHDQTTTYIKYNTGNIANFNSHSSYPSTISFIFNNSDITWTEDALNSLDIVILEGDLNENPPTEYFEGMQSSFEDQLVTQEMVDSGKEKAENLGKYKVKYEVTGKNKLLINEENGVFTDRVVSYSDNEILMESSDSGGWKYDCIDIIPVKKNTQYTLSYNCEKLINGEESNIKIFGTDYRGDAGNNYLISGDKGKTFVQKTFNTYNHEFIYVLAYTVADSEGYNLEQKIRFYNIQIEEGNVATSYEPYRESINTFYLNSPLMKGDTIEVINGQATHVRRYRQIEFDGSDDEAWVSHTGTNTHHVFKHIINDIQRAPYINVGSSLEDYMMCDKFNSRMFNSDAVNFEAIRPARDYDWIMISIEKSKLPSVDVKNFKAWLKLNPVKVVYKLKNPIYEPIKTDLSVQLFEGTTHISNNSNIPANMETTVDRVLNRATEAIELAKINPTTENLSRARMWVNLASESVKKDELQSEINNITNIDDLQLERKTVTSNLDVYVKSENMLSLSLNTNSITFDGYSGVEDMEMLGAVNISINSSLPYDLNAYLPSEIANSDKSNIMDIEMLKIKESSNTSYQNFVNTADKIVLKDSCNAGNNLIHNIDLKLASNQAHKADVYKTVIKFEAEQK